jgi:hypothetical protein
MLLCQLVVVVFWCNLVWQVKSESQSQQLLVNDTDNNNNGDSSRSLLATACSRDISRRVRSYLNQDIFPHVAINAVDLPAACPLNPLVDIFGDQEFHKREANMQEWRVCSLSVYGLCPLAAHSVNLSIYLPINNLPLCCVGHLVSVLRQTVC